MEYNIRKPEIKDAEQIIEHKEFVTEAYPETLATPIEDRGIPLDQQEENITSLTKNDLGLVVEADGRIVGILNLRQNPRKKFEHVCQFGVSLQPKYAGHGIGSELIERAIKHAEESTVLEKIVLDVFANNEGAIRFYERLGFVQEGRQKDQVKLKDGYTDLIQMAKFVK